MIAEYIMSYPKTSIIVIGILVSLFISIVQYFVMDKDKMRDLKAKQKTLNEQMKLHKENPQKMMEIQKELLGHSMESMKHSFKPMLITTIPILIVFGFIRSSFAVTEIAKSWFWWYFGSSIVASLLFRKWFNLP
jgi:uncharacterized membrane protein (DUF106 family)